jgi:hypothetical protein
MEIINAAGMVLAGFLAFLLALHVAVVGGVLAYHHALEGLRHRRAKHQGDSPASNPR